MLCLMRKGETVFSLSAPIPFLKGVPSHNYLSFPSLNPAAGLLRVASCKVFVEIRLLTPWVCSTRSVQTVVFCRP